MDLAHRQDNDLYRRSRSGGGFPPQKHPDGGWDE